MRQYYIAVSGILLIVPIALAAPVLVQENRQAGIDAVHIPEDAMTTMLKLGKRGDVRDELWLKFLKKFEGHFTPSKAPESGWTDVDGRLPSIPENPSSSSGHELMAEGEEKEPGHHDAPPQAGPGPSTTESDHHESGSTTGVVAHAPLSSPVFPTWFHPDHGPVGEHPPPPNLGPSGPSPSSSSSTEFDSDHRLVVEEPPSRSASPTVSDVDHGYQLVHPPRPSPGSVSPMESDDELVDVPPPSSPEH